MKKILLSGSCGFIFSNFLRYARENTDYEIVSIDKLVEHTNVLNILPGHEPYIGDITDPHFVNRVFEQEKPDIVIHAAAESHVDASIESALVFIHANVVGTQVMIDNALKHGVERFVYVSTDEVMGHHTSASTVGWAEDAITNPRNPYCLTADSLVLTANGTWQYIPSIQRQDVVSSFLFEKNQQQYAKVSDALNRVGTQLVDIRTEFGTIKCSPEHTLFAKRFKRFADGSLDSANKTKAKVEEIQCKNVVVGDFLAFQRTDPEPQNSINIDNDLCRFLGYFLGDGSLHLGGRGRTSWYIRLADESKDRLEFYADLIRKFTLKLFGREASPCYFKHSSKNCWYLSVGCQPLVDTIKRLGFNKHANEKTIPNEIFQWSNNAIFQFLAGYFDADGSVSSNAKRKNIIFGSASIDLVKSISLLFRRAGVLVHKPDKQIKIHNNKKYEFWRGSISDSKSFMLFKKNIPSDKQLLDFEIGKPQYMLNDDNIIWSRIQEKKEYYTTETLYDLTVPETSNFVANGFIVHNSASKLGGELLVKAAHETHGLQYNITRSCNNYGERQPPRNLVPRIITSLLLGQKIPIHGNGLNMREWIYVEDNCTAMLKILEKAPANEIYNIGTGVQLQNIQMVNHISEFMSIIPKIEYVQDRKGHDFSYLVNSNKIRSLGWEPKYSFEEGMKKSIKWYVDNSNRYLGKEAR